MTQLYSFNSTLFIFDADIDCSSFGIQERHYLLEKDQLSGLIVDWKIVVFELDEKILVCVYLLILFKRFSAPEALLLHIITTLEEYN